METGCGYDADLGGTVEVWNHFVPNNFLNWQRPVFTLD